MIDLVNPHPNHGQIEKSFQNEFYAKWGKDYLRSFLRFHELEIYGNLKDESLQSYVTPQFAIIRKAGNKIFLKHSSIRAKRNKKTVYDIYGGCFDGNSIVQLKKGQKRVRDISKGEILFDGGVVDCLIETVQNKKQRVVEINVSLFSPVIHEAQWEQGLYN